MFYLMFEIQLLNQDINLLQSTEKCLVKDKMHFKHTATPKLRDVLQYVDIGIAYQIFIGFPGAILCPHDCTLDSNQLYLYKPL